MNIAHHISNLLLEHDCVIVPGLGAFVATYRPASIHPVEHTISPPGKSIAFNKNLVHNDGLLIQTLAEQSVLSFKDAQQEVETFAERCLQQLTRNEVILLKNIGKLYLDVEQHIRFLPQADVNHLKTSYGLSKVKATPVLRGKVALLDDTGREVLPMTTKTGSHRKKWWLAAAIFVAMCVSGFTSLYYTNDSFRAGICDITAMAGLMQPEKVTIEHYVPTPTPVYTPPENPEVADEPVTDTTASSDKETAVTTLPAEEPENTDDGITFPENTLPSGRYAIVGAFKEPANANHRLEEAKALFPQSYQFLRNGLYHVGVYVNGSKGEAINNLQSVREQLEPSAWLLYRN